MFSYYPQGYSLALEGATTASNENEGVENKLLFSYLF